MPPRMGAWQPERLRYGAATKSQRVAEEFPERKPSKAKPDAYLLGPQPNPLYPPVGDFADYQLVRVPAIDLVGGAEPAEHRAVQLQPVDFTAFHGIGFVGVGAIQILVRPGPNADRPRGAYIGDLALKAALVIEDLNPAVAAIRYVHVAARIGGDGERQVDLARSRPARAPGLEETPVTVELRDSRVAVSVGHEDVARRIPCDIAGPVEGVARDARARVGAAAAATGVGDGFGLAAQRLHDAAFGRELDHHVGAAVHHPDMVVGIHAHGLCEQKAIHALTDFAHELARAVELEQARTAVREGARRAPRGVGAA